MKKTKKNLFSTFLKIGVTLLLLYAIFTKIPFDEVWEILKKSNGIFLGISLLFFVLSQWISAKRLLLLFKSVNFSLSDNSNYILYLIGMFYNFFIPGGIGGDTYKVYILHKRFDWSVKKLSAAVLLDRFIGLTAIGILLTSLIVFIPFIIEENLVWVAPFILIAGVLSSYYFTKRIFLSFLKAYWKSLFLSMLVQVLQCLSIVFILKSMATTEVNQYIPYVVVFLISSVLSVFSFSGIGIREMIFYQAATLFVFHSTTAVTVGLLFSILTAFVSLSGIIFHFRKPEFTLKEVSSITTQNNT
ncbi:lysylphosphatidylglycerol synthase transmembrane domain-containing protein [Aquimarina longa]|uniref:lysylphosphatidylglycerol synthase transmembrane domain-containing protein n=1 Tax=Aquimarina longa TaxID=1080221 RepID=UPI000783DD8A|nr:lysylphosphatidylglycerol synthase transmembrane domain-containing protein [Aquimarina longa]